MKRTASFQEENNRRNGSAGISDRKFTRSRETGMREGWEQWFFVFIAVAGKEGVSWKRIKTEAIKS